MTTLLLALALVAYHPREIVVTDRFDLCEFNHFFDEHGKLVFDQIIFYQWDANATRYQITAWRLAKHRTQVPFFDHARNQWVSVWQDGDTLRKVTTTAYRETWTQTDPELYDRSFLPKDQRRELSELPQRAVRRVMWSVLKKSD